jgi:pre-mRNA-processing factor SLU7
MIKNSYCTGDEGKNAFAEADRLRTGDIFEDNEPIKEIGWVSAEEVDQQANPLKEDSIAQHPAKKRTMEEMKGGVSEEDMDEYRRKRTAANDPMAAFIGKDELL